MAPTRQNTRSLVRLYILHMHEYLSATGGNYIVVVSILITIRNCRFCFYSNNDVLLAQRNEGITSCCLLEFLIIDFYKNVVVKFAYKFTE